MKFILKESKEDYLYHATYGAYINSIIKQGLIINNHHNWEDSKNVIDLAIDPDIAVSFCETAENVSDDIYNSGIYVITIDRDKLDSSKLSLDTNVLLDDDEEPYAFEYSEDIPTSAFINVEEYI